LTPATRIHGRQIGGAMKKYLSFRLSQMAIGNDVRQAGRYPMQGNPSTTDFWLGTRFAGFGLDLVFRIMASRKQNWWARIEVVAGPGEVGTSAKLAA